MKFTKERWINETNCSLAFLILLPAQRNAEIISEEQHVIFAYELQSALRLMFGFSDIHCEL